jgi:hypothetical protein
LLLLRIRQIQFIPEPMIVMAPMTFVGRA